MPVSVHGCMHRKKEIQLLCEVLLYYAEGKTKQSKVEISLADEGLGLAVKLTFGQDLMEAREQLTAVLVI